MSRCRGDAEVREALAAAMAGERLRIVASLIRTTRDWDLAEDAVADAAERALLTWPRDGVPRNPAAWLTTTAQRRALDVIRRAGTERTKLAELGAQQELDEQGKEAAVDHGAVADDRLRLVFTCCHPALSMEARVALTLKVVAGLATDDVARMFLVGEATMSQRLLRAKKRIANAGIPYRVPEAADLPERLDGVLAVVYLVFTQGYAGAAAPELAEEAIRLGRLLADLMPDEDEVSALLALMLAQHARRDARLVDGELVTLEHQDRSRWDREAVAEALSLTMPHGRVPGPYRLQAELALTHLRAEHADDTDWRRIVRLYERLLDLHPSPVISLNRAIAVGMAESPAAGLLLLDDLAGAPRPAGAAPAPGGPRRPAGPGRADGRSGRRGRAWPSPSLRPTRSAANWVSGATGSAEPPSRWGYRVPREAGRSSRAWGDHHEQPHNSGRSGLDRTGHRGQHRHHQLRQRRPAEAPAAKPAATREGRDHQRSAQDGAHRHVDGEQVAGRRSAWAPSVDPLPLAPGSHEVTFSDGSQDITSHRRCHRGRSPATSSCIGPPRSAARRWSASTRRRTSPIDPGKARVLLAHTATAPLPTWSSTARPCSPTSPTASSPRPTWPPARTRSRCSRPG